MTSSWAAQFPQTSLRVAAQARNYAEVEVLLEGETVWLRGTFKDSQLVRDLRSIPGARLYHWLDDGQLVQFGYRVPVARLPETGWVAFSTKLDFEFPPSSFPGTLERVLDLRLLRCEEEAELAEATVMVARLDAWYGFGTTTAQVRLRPLRFAANEHQDIVIVGRPLPSIPGIRYECRDDVAVPLGYCWVPAVSSRVVRQSLNAPEGALVLIHVDGSRDVIAKEAFVQATRSGIRRTKQRFMEDP